MTTGTAAEKRELRLEWNKPDGRWHSLRDVSLDDPSVGDQDGVYIIWHGGRNRRVVYVGSGRIATRLSAHLYDGRFLPYAHLGLGVTWAEVPMKHQRGVERFLAEEMEPVAGGRYPNAAPIAVNLPW